MKQYKLFLFLPLCLALLTVQAQQTRSSFKFTENKNQWEDHILYRADIPAGKLFLGKSRMTYIFWDPHFFERLHDHKHSNEQGKELDPYLLKMHAFHVNFVGSNLNAVTEGERERKEKTNFFLGDDPSKWASNLSSYEKINYQELYPGINFSIFEHSSMLKYEFSVKAGKDASVIQMQYEGADQVYVENSRLHIRTSVVNMAEEKPYAYQMINGKTVEVACEFVVENNTVRFRFPKGYNSSYDLVIDPKLIFATYSGATSDNWGNSACFDNDGNLYSAGTTFHTGFPATVGAFQTTYQGRPSNLIGSYGIGIDCAILKFSDDGTDLLAATYLGGYESEMPFSIFVNYDGELIILGATSSSGVGGAKFPVTAGAFQTTYGGGTDITPVGGVRFFRGSDLFVARMSGDLSNLLSCTYVGGSANDGILYQLEAITRNYGDQFRGDVITDSLNNVYVVSNTRSTNFPFPATGTMYDNTYNGGLTDGVVFKLSPDLSTMVWCNYLGGSGQDAAFSIQLDSLKNVFVAGGTVSSDFPTTAGVIHPTYQGGGDGFVAHISKDGDNLINATYIGTASYDQTYFIQLDTLDHVYLLGQTSGSYPVTGGVYSNSNGGQFIHKIDNDLNITYYATVFGSGGFQPNISPTAFLINDCENIFINGWGGEENQGAGYVYGSTNNLPITSGAFQTTTDGSDFYLMVLEKDAKSLLYATYIGDLNNGDHVDGGTSRFDKKGIVYAAVCGGCGGSSGFPTHPNPGAWSNINQSYFYDPSTDDYYSNCNNVAFKFDLANLKADFTADTLSGCATGTSVTLTNTSLGGSTFTWLLDGNVFSNSSTTTHLTLTEPGNYLIQLVATDKTTCIGKDTAEKIITVYPTPPFNVNILDSVICKGDTIQLIADNDPDYIYQWTPNKWISNTTIYNPEVWPDTSITYYLHVTDENGCEDTDTVHIKVAYISTNTSWENLTDCLGIPKASFKNKSYGPLNYLWDFGDGHTSTNPSPSHVYQTPGSYQVTVDISNDGCEDKDTINIVLEAVKVPNLMTRNGDGLNDLFKIQGMTKDWHVEIYNRWGKPLYSSDNYPNDWAGEELSDGIYYYLIITPEGTECKGWVHLMK